jgi:hypothetical protein
MDEQAPNDAAALQPNPQDVVFCLYEESPDSFAACWLLRKLARSLQFPVEFGTSLSEKDDFEGRNVILIGHAFDEIDVRQFIDRKAKSVLLIGDEKGELHDALPVAEWRRTFPFGIESLVREPHKAGAVAGRSLALSAWLYLFASRAGFDKTPRLVDQIQDHYSGDHKYADSEAVTACVASYDLNFKTYDALSEALEDRRRRDLVVAGGQAILRQNARVNA